MRGWYFDYLRPTVLRHTGSLYCQKKIKKMTRREDKSQKLVLNPPLVSSVVVLSAVQYGTAITETNPPLDKKKGPRVNYLLVNTVITMRAGASNTKELHTQETALEMAYCSTCTAYLRKVGGDGRCNRTV
jgi:hypothetical protein